VIAFVTSSEGKFAEAIRLSNLPLERIDLDLPEPQGLDVSAVVRSKAAAAWKIVGRPVIVEDTALELSALGGFPGPLVKWLLSSAGAEAIPRMLAAYDDRRAVARAAIAYADEKGLLVVHGSVAGSIAFPKGTSGFGWDPVFRPEGQELTFAEMAPEAKDAVSHRARAFAALHEALAQRGLPADSGEPDLS
jgi:non-canonical purine NTP pyrophosphatase (RdgB/HAM1 family)